MVLELLLEPEAERSYVVFWNAAAVRRLALICRAQVLLDILIIGFDGDKSLSFVVDLILEDKFIGGLRKDNNIDL